MSDGELVNAELRIQLESDVRDNIEQLLTAVDDVNAIVDMLNRDINDSPAPHIKTLARSIRRTARQSLRLSRLVVAALSDADVGGGDA